MTKRLEREAAPCEGIGDDVGGAGVGHAGVGRGHEGHDDGLDWLEGVGQSVAEVVNHGEKAALLLVSHSIVCIGGAVSGDAIGAALLTVGSVVVEVFGGGECGGGADGIKRERRLLLLLWLWLLL